MLNSAENKREAKNVSANSQKGIENHKKITSHLEEAAKHHREAVKYHEEGNYEKAHKNSIFAHGYCCIARELLREDAKNYSMNEPPELKNIEEAS